jgi:hypothetical protein
MTKKLATFGPPDPGISFQNAKVAPEAEFIQFLLAMIYRSFTDFRPSCWNCSISLDAIIQQVYCSTNASGGDSTHKSLS